MSFAFKRFNFFSQVDCVGHAFPQGAVCSCEADGRCLVGCDNGQVCVLDASYQVVHAFTAHGHKTLYIFALETKLVLTLGVEEPGISSAVLKLWDVDRLAAGASSQPLKTHRLFNPKYPESEVTSMAVSENSGSQLLVAIGLGSGWVYMLQGDAHGRGRFHHLQKLSVRPDASDLWAVYGLQFTGESNGSALYAVTESETLCMNATTGAKILLDTQGVRVGSCCLVKGGLLVVARDDALYDYTPETRAGCLVFGGSKRRLLQLRRYLLVVTSEVSEQGVATSTVSITDPKNKLVAGSFTLPSVVHVACFQGAVYILQGNGRLVRLVEEDLGLQLDALFKRSLFKLALDVAGAQSADESILTAIHQRWGDHLYSKGEFESAMAQYLDTIGHLEPSYVIRRFLDAQRIHSLTSYLEALHQKGLAIADHTTLLLNCYTKLKDVEKLDVFVQRGSSSTDSLKFDMETAVKVLRAAGYHRHALEVADRAGNAGWQLDILLEDLRSFDATVSFLQKMEKQDMVAALQKYGKLLTTHRPETTTALLMDLCAPPPGAEQEYVASVSDFVHLYADRPSALIILCEFVLNNLANPPAENMLYHTLMELYLMPQLSDGADPLDSLDEPVSEEVSAQERRVKALELLQRGWPAHLTTPKYDPQQALVLCRVHGFKEGLVFLYDKMRLPQEVLQVYMAYGDDSGLIQACVKYGDTKKGGDPSLWALTLRYLCNQDRDCTAQLVEVLEHVEKNRALPLLVVLQALASNKSVKVSLVKGYVARVLGRETNEINSDRASVQRLQAETAQMRAEVQRQKSQARVFQNSRCAATGQPLELPVVHFLCGHSYNLRALGENDQECPMCAADFKKVLEIRRNMRAGGLQQDRFFTELRETADGFGVVAEHFGRGLMNMTVQATRSS